MALRHQCLKYMDVHMVIHKQYWEIIQKSGEVHVQTPILWVCINDLGKSLRRVW